MDVRYPGFGAIDVDGTRYDHDVIVEAGAVRKRDKGPSKPRKTEFGHTPLTVDEDLPWSASRMVVGTGAQGRLPVTAEVIAEAERRGVQLVTVPTSRACELLREHDQDTAAVLHVTC